MRLIHMYFLMIVFVVGIALPQGLHAQASAKSLGDAFFGYSGQFRYLPKDDIFSTNFLRDSTYVYKIDQGEESDWILTDKYWYTYDNQGRKIESIYGTSSKPGVWENKIRLKNYYNADQFLHFQNEYDWNADSAQWVRNLRRSYSYNLVGLEDIIFTEQWLENKWKLSSKVEYNYNSSYAISEEVNFLRDTTNENWKAVSRYLFSYFDSENLEQEVYQVWIDSLSHWVNKEIRKYAYNGNRLVSTTKSDWNSKKMDWTDASIISLIYNEEGKLDTTSQTILSSESGSVTPVQSQNSDYDSDGNVGEVINSLWNAESESWEPHQKKVNFWSKYLNGNLEQTTDNILCVFANPYIIGLPWYCESLKPNVLYSIEVFDTYGRQFYSDQFMGKSTFRISKPIPAGLYYVVIRGGLDYHTEKVLIRN